MEFDESRLSDMQRAMINPSRSGDERCEIFNRDLTVVGYVFDVVCGRRGSFSSTINRMIKACPLDEAFVVLDGGGGAGGVVDDIVSGYYVSKFGFKARKCLRGILLDLNPLPELRNCPWDEEDRNYYGFPEVECRKGDVRSLSEFPDESVNLYMLYEVAHYVDDLLAVLQEAYRVLKDGGLMVMNFDTRMATDPSLQEILKEVDPEGRVFTVKPNGYDGYSIVLACRKVSGVGLRFPYKFIGSRRRDFSPRDLYLLSYLADISLVGMYERI